MKYDIYQADCLDLLSSIPTGSADLIITSPPYNIGKNYEKKNLLSFYEYIQWQSKVIQLATMACSDKGSICWQVGNFIDHDGVVMPLDCVLWNSFILQGLIPRNRIVWTFDHGLHCKNRFSGRHETVLWFTKGKEYTFNLDPVRVPQKYKNKKHYKGPKKGLLSCNPLGKNPGDVWHIPNVKHNHVEKTEHECQFPYELAARLVLSLTNKGDLVVDPFMGSGTSGVAAALHERSFSGCDTDMKSINIAKDRIAKAIDGTVNVRTGFYSDEIGGK